MRVVFFGSPDDAVVSLRALVESGVDVALVVTQPDRRRSRRGAESPSPVRSAAEELGLAVRTPRRAGELSEEVAALDADLGVVVAFGQILPTALLDATRSGFVNIHFSLLPRWRGAAPVERAILAGDTTTGVCLMDVEEGLDTGGVYAVERTTIGDSESAGELRGRLAAMGAGLLVRELERIPDTAPAPQMGEPTYASKLTVDEFRLDPSRPAAELARVVRAGNPRPGAWFVIGGRRVKVLEARPAPAADGHVGAIGTNPPMLVTSRGGLELVTVQPESKKAMSADAWMAGLHGATSVDLGS